MTIGRARLEFVWFTLAGLMGLSVGFGFSTLAWDDFVVVVTLMGLALLGEALQVRLGHLAAVTLRPAIVFVALWNWGLGHALLVGLVPLLVASVVGDRKSGLEALSAIGGEALALLLGASLYIALKGTVLSTASSVPGEEMARIAGVLGYWCALIPLQALTLGKSDGIQFQRALEELVRRTRFHVLFLSCCAFALEYVSSKLGLVVMGIAVIVLIEAYYPWKMVGDQNGVLLTSLQMMAQAVDLKDPYTSNHSQRVSRYAVRIARAMGLPEEEVERIRIGALMHDIGKIGVSGKIIRKPARLTAEEAEVMRKHSSLSAEIIEPLEILGESAQMVRYHHEHCDGSGYPSGLRREEIPVGSRIILVADAFDALTTDRPYRKGVARSEAVAVIRKNSGTQFDPDVVMVLERIAGIL